MLHAGVPVDSEYDNSSTALQHAAMKNRSNVTKLLLNSGAAINKRSGIDRSTALHKAVSNNSTDVVKILLKGRASTDIKDRHGRKPIYYARHQKNEAAVRLLERH